MASENASERDDMVGIEIMFEYRSLTVMLTKFNLDQGDGRWPLSIK